MFLAMSPQPMKPTSSWWSAEQCFMETAPAAPVRRSVMKRFSWKTPRGAPVSAETTTKMPLPVGRFFSRFFVKETQASCGNDEERSDEDENVRVCEYVNV